MHDHVENIILVDWFLKIQLTSTVSIAVLTLSNVLRSICDTNKFQLLKVAFWKKLMKNYQLLKIYEQLHSFRKETQFSHLIHIFHLIKNDFILCRNLKLKSCENKIFECFMLHCSLCFKFFINLYWVETEILHFVFNNNSFWLFSEINLLIYLIFFWFKAMYNHSYTLARTTFLLENVFGKTFSII